MTDDRIWEESSVAERCEILRRRMDDIHASKPTGLHVDPDEWARLRRIEAAAMAWVEKWRNEDHRVDEANALARAIES